MLWEKEAKTWGGKLLTELPKLLKPSQISSSKMARRDRQTGQPCTFDIYILLLHATLLLNYLFEGKILSRPEG